MNSPRVFADFHNADAQGRLRLNCIGTIEDLARQHIELQNGQSLTLYSEDLEVDGTMQYSEAENLWVAAIDWQKIRQIEELVVQAHFQTYKSEDLLILQEGEYRPDAPIAVIGAGTGLGEAFVIKGRVYATEGGHVDFAARTPEEFELLKYLKAKYNLDRVSVERVVSGPGIVNIYQFLRDEKHLKESPEIADKMSDGDRAEAIAQAALNKSDPLCEKAMQMFIAAYGAEVGNFALKLLPYGGLYVAGGIAPKILPLIQEGRFLKKVTEKGRMKELIQKIPLYIIRKSHVGLIGAAHYAATKL